LQHATHFPFIAAYDNNRKTMPGDLESVVLWPPGSQVVPIPPTQSFEFCNFPQGGYGDLITALEATHYCAILVNNRGIVDPKDDFRIIVIDERRIQPTRVHECISHGAGLKRTWATPSRTKGLPNMMQT
jgi:hypothetical protein